MAQLPVRKRRPPGTPSDGGEDFDALYEEDQWQLGAAAKQQRLEMPANAFAFLSYVTDGGLQRVVDSAATFMPPIRNTNVTWTLPGATDPLQIAIEPKPSTQLAHGNILFALPWMGGGKTTAKRNYQKVLIRENPRTRTLDLDCNRIYSTSNAVNLKATAGELRAEGLVDVQAAGYMDEKQTVDLSRYQMVGCSFESLFKVEGQSFGLITCDETSALALKIGGGTMQHFECVYDLRELLAPPGTRLLCLDAAGAFKMSETEPCTVSEHFFKLVAPQRSVLCLSLDPANMPHHLQRRLRVYYDTEKSSRRLFWAQVESAIAARQADNSLLLFFSVGTKKVGRGDVCSRLKEHGVSHRFYHGESNESVRFRDLADPGKHWASLGGVVATTVVGRGVDLPGPPSLNVHRIFVVMAGVGCDFGDQFQTMLRARHVQNATIEVLLTRCLSPERRAELVRAGKRNPIVQPTYEGMLAWERKRRGFALRAAERQARAAGVANDSTSAADALLRVMAHARLNRQMQLIDPVYAFQRYAEYYGMPIEAAAPPASQKAAQGELEYDEDEEFDQCNHSLGKWTIVVQEIREGGESEFIDNECLGLASEESRKSNELSAKDKWKVKAYDACKHIGELPDWPTNELTDNSGGVESDSSGDAAPAGEGEAEPEDPAAAVLHSWLGDGSDRHNLTPAFKLQAHCLVRTPDEQMQQDNALKLETAMRGRPGKHEHCEYGLGQKMALVQRLGKLLMPGELRHVKQVFDKTDGIVGCANTELVGVANRQIQKKLTPDDESLMQQLRQIAEELGVGGRLGSLPEVLKGLGREIGLTLKYKTKQTRQPDGSRPHLLLADPGLHFERMLPEVVAKWLIYSPMLGTKVSVTDWHTAHAESQLEQAERLAASDDHDYGNLFAAPFDCAADARANANERVELIDDRALKHQLQRLQGLSERGAWMDKAPERVRQNWGRDQKAAHKRHLSNVSALDMAKAIDHAAEEPVARGARKLFVVYGKNSLGLGRRTASYPSMQQCSKELRRALCCARYHDVDIVSCHPTLMLQVVRKMVAVGALQWSDPLDKLVEYAELDAVGKPAGRMPMLLRIADHFGIDRSVAKDVAKELVLRVLNGGSAWAWCRDMGIAMPEGVGPGADLDDLAEVARVVRDAFFKMLERDHPGSLKVLRDGVWAKLVDECQRAKQDAQRKGEPPPQQPTYSRRDRAMLSQCIFELEDRVLDCIDRKLQAIGWTVASLIYDGVRPQLPTSCPGTPAIALTCPSLRPV